MTMTATHPGLDALLDAIADGRPRWQGLAACRGIDTNLFYPTDNKSPVAARTVCRRCPVRQDCFAHAITEREQHGVWGNTSARHRRHLHSQAEVAAS